ncbi:MAG: hypothetical protein ACRCUY_09980 [Thermoguttaceae bacterium]
MLTHRLEVAALGSRVTIKIQSPIGATLPNPVGVRGRIPMPNKTRQLTLAARRNKLADQMPVLTHRIVNLDFG